MNRRHRGEGTVTQLPDGRWTGKLSLGVIDGKRRRRTFYGPTKGDVLRQMREYRPPAAGASSAVGDWLRRWLADKRLTVEAGTYRPYSLHVAAMLPHVAGRTLADLTPDDVRGVYVALAADGRSAVGVAKCAITLRAALADAVRARLIAHNSASSVRPPKTAPREARALTVEQVKRFLDAASEDRLYPLYALAVDSGARRGELFGLHWPEVDLRAGAITIRQSLEDEEGGPRLKAPKTPRSRRRILLAAPTVEALVAYRRRQAAYGRDVDSGPVFTALSGKYLRGKAFLRGSLWPVLRRAGLVGWCWKDCTRHTCASLLLAAGVNIKAVSERLGHATIVRTLSTYIHVMPGTQERAAATMGGIIG